MGPEAAARYERLRPPAAGVVPRPCGEVHVLQSCGLALWAQTCAPSARAPTDGAPLARRAGAPLRAAGLVPDTLRQPMVAILASMLLHPRHGGSHDGHPLALGPPCPGLRPA